MHKPRISVIVPIYNVEKYLDRCLDTIKNQTFVDFEVLLINDGTPDRSMDIAEKYADEDSRFIIYNKTNGGLSDARNYGIDRARGEFLVFVDSDDYLHEDYLKTMYEDCISNNADMAYCRFKHTGDKTGVKIPSINPKKSVIDRDKALDMLIRDKRMHSYAWNKMYRRALFTDNDIRYPIMFFEDVATSARLLFHANKIAITDKNLYFYVRRSGSIMSTMSSKKIEHLLLSILITRNYIQLHGEYDKYKKAIRAVALKMRLINIYSIIRQHILSWNFRDMKKNLRTNKMLYSYIISDNYEPVDGYPKLPYSIIQPEKKKKL